MRLTITTITAAIFLGTMTLGGCASQSSPAEEESPPRPADFDRLLLGEAMASIARSGISGVFDYDHPLIKRLQEQLFAADTLAVRWSLAASLIEILNERQLEHREEATVWLLRHVFSRQFEITSDETNSSAYCRNYYECALYLSAMHRIAKVAPSSAREHLQAFRTDLSIANYGRLPTALSIIIYQTESLINYCDFNTTTGFDSPLAQAKRHHIATTAQLDTLEENYRSLTESFFFKAFTLPLRLGTGQGGSAWEQIATNLEEDFMRSLPEGETHNASALATELVTLVKQTHFENQAYLRYIDRLGYVDPSQWLTDLDNTTANAYMLQQFMPREINGPFARDFLMRFTRMILSLSDSVDEEIQASLDVWRRAHQDTRTHMNNELTSLGIKLLKADDDRAIAVTTSQNPLRFDLHHHSLMDRIHTLSSNMTSLMLRLTQNTEANADETLQQIWSYDLDRLALDCLALDARVRPEVDATLLDTPVKSAILPESFEESSLFRSGDTMASLCFYDSDPRERRRRYRERDVSGIERRLEQFKGDRLSFQEIANIVDITTMKASILLSSIPFSVAAGAGSHVAMDGSRSLVRILGSQARNIGQRAAGSRTWRSALARMVPLQRMASHSLTRRLTRVAAGGAGFGARQINELLHCYVGAWAFGQQMKLMTRAPSAIREGEINLVDLVNTPFNFGNVMGMLIFRGLPISNHLFVAGQGGRWQGVGQWIGNRLVGRGTMSQAYMPQFMERVGLAHDTALFAWALPQFEKTIHGNFHQDEELAPIFEQLNQNEAWENNFHAFLIAAAFRSQAFYAKFLGERAEPLPRQDFERIVSGQNSTDTEAGTRYNQYQQNPSGEN